jgi:hypothetical protein
MSKSKVVAAAAVSVLMFAGTASSASAQIGRYDGDGNDRRHDQRHDQGRDHEDLRGGGQLTTGYVDGLQWRIQQAAREGRISWGQARNLQQDLTRVQPIAFRYQTGQARRWEVDQLQRVVSRIEAVTGRRF